MNQYLSESKEYIKELKMSKLLNNYSPSCRQLMVEKFFLLQFITYITTLKVRYYITTLPHYYSSLLTLQYLQHVTISLHYHIILHYNIIKHYYITTLLHYFITALLHYYITLLHYYSAVLLHY